MPNAQVRRLIPPEVSKPASTFDNERYSSLVNILKDSEVYTLNADGVIVCSNLDAVNITGYEEWEVAGKSSSIFYPLEDQLTGKPLENLMQAEKSGTYVFTGLLKKKRNVSFWAKVKIKSMYAEGELVGYRLSVQDATHKAVTNHRMQRMKDEYLALFSNPFVGILKFSMKDYCIFTMNEKAEGLVRNADVRKKIFFNEIFESQDSFRTLIQLLVNQKKVEDFECKVNADKWLLLSLRYFPHEEFVEGIVVDISEVKRKDRELLRVSNELDEFIYHASHELRSPLVSMLGITNLINIECESGVVKNYAKMLEERIHRLDNLLKGIVAIPYNNKNALSSDLISWESLIHTSVKTAGLNSKVKVQTTITQDWPFMADASRLKIVFQNIISNAFKFYNPNIREPKLDIKIYSGAESASISFIDNGVGIDSFYLENIFKLFYRAHTNFTGSGLGLYIAKSMIDTLGGKINVASDLQKGTIFTVVIPNRAM